MKALVRMNWILLAILVVSCISLVIISQLNRQAFINLSKVENIGQQYDIVWGQLLIQEGAISNPLIILDRARGELEMVPPNAENSQLMSHFEENVRRWQQNAENKVRAPNE